MSQQRRIFLEAMVVSLFGHAIFFSVFTVREPVPGREPPRPAVLTVGRFEQPSQLLAATGTSPAATSPEQRERLEMERRTTAPALELDRPAELLEDDPELSAPAPPGVGNETWAFGKEPAAMRTELAADYDAGPSLSVTREALAATGGEALQRRIRFDIPVRKVPGAGTLMLSPDQATGEDVRLFRIEVRLDVASGKVDLFIRPTGDPQIDEAIIRALRRRQFRIERTEAGYQLRAQIPVPASMPAGGPSHRPALTDELLDNGPTGEGS